MIPLKQKESFSFPKVLRIRKKEEFKQLSLSGKKCIGKFFVIEYCNSSSSESRLGITVSRSFGNAHLRNRFKRLIRESFRLIYNDLPKGLDLNVRPRNCAKEATLQSCILEFQTFAKEKNN